MDLRGYVRAVRKSWWLVVVAMLIGAGVAAAFVVSATPVYAAKLTFYVSTPLLSDNNSLQSTDQFAQDRANSYANLLSSDGLARMVVKTADLKMSPNRVAAEITGAARLNTVLVTATINDASPARALKIAQAVAQDMPTLVEQLDRSSTSTTQPPVSLHVVSGPSVGASPVSPRKKLDIAFGLGVGLILGLAIAVLRELLDTAIRSGESLAELTDHPVLGEIAFDPAARKTPLIVDEEHAGQRSEDFRRLRTSLQFLGVAKPLRVIVVTSPLDGEGKSTTAANLGVVMAEAGQRVALIEADLRRPKLSSYLGLERASGLTSVLSGQAEVADVLQPWGGNGLQMLASGPLPPNPSELLGSQQMAGVLAELQETFDVVIIDAPPLLPVTDAAVLSTHGAGMVLVVRHGKTKRAQLTAALKTLETVNARVLGTVLNMRPVKGVDAAPYAASYYAASEAVVRLDADSDGPKTADALSPTPATRPSGSDGERDTTPRSPTYRSRMRRSRQRDRTRGLEAGGRPRRPSTADLSRVQDVLPESIEPAHNSAKSS